MAVTRRRTLWAVGAAAASGLGWIAVPKCPMCLMAYAATFFRFFLS